MSEEPFGAFQFTSAELATELATELDYLRSLRKGRGKKPITKAEFNRAAGKIKRQFEALEAEV